MLDAKQLAAFLGVTADAVYASATLRAIARPIDLGGASSRPRLRWLESDVIDAFPQTSDTSRDAAAENGSADAVSSERPRPTARTARRSLPGQAPLLDIRPPRRRP
jgi:predicted DNA-binding transcriptional regulator AlpA